MNVLDVAVGEQVEEVWMVMEYVEQVCLSLAGG